ncbi:neuronal pentraxin-2 [Latimeria chalumnae]|uniref:neuronal pentraxin-2 n=1 Tax=Latimeria chalumnae TaxID=7897 RepID=UPI00313DB4D8
MTSSHFWFLSALGFLPNFAMLCFGDFHQSPPRYVCIPLPPDPDQHGPWQSGAHQGEFSDETKATILHLRENLVQQKEILLEQRETIQELMAKLAICQGFGHHHERECEHHHHSSGSHEDNHDGHPHEDGHEHEHDHDHDYHEEEDGHHSDRHNHHFDSHAEHHGTTESHSHAPHRTAGLKNTMGDPPKPSVEQMGRTLQSLKERLELLQNGRNTTFLSGSLRQKKPLVWERFRERGGGGADPHDHSKEEGHYSRWEHDHEDDAHPNTLNVIMGSLFHHRTNSKPKTSLPRADDFRLHFPLRTNYMYARLRHSLTRELFAFSACLWLKPNAGADVGTPFSYAVPGQANELLLIEWGNNPMELLINDKVATLPLTINDGEWHHVCITWSTRDGIWESYQDGVKRGGGENLAPWHPIKPGGVFILGQEQDTLGGRFDATQAFVGDMSDFHLWDHVLTPSEIFDLATCSSHLTGNILQWAEPEVELHGGVAKLPFNSCH